MKLGELLQTAEHPRCASTLRVIPGLEDILYPKHLILNET